MLYRIWHITFATYGSRLHGDERPTVDREHNRFCEPYLEADPARVAREGAAMAGSTVLLSAEQCSFVEGVLPEICRRGGWEILEAAAAANHVHVVCRIPRDVHGKVARRWMKRWLTQALDERWRCVKRPDGMSWWSEGGSARAVTTRDYAACAARYVRVQRTGGNEKEEESGREGRRG